MSTRELASFLSTVRFDDLPQEAVLRTKELFLDWIGSALAGRNARQVTSFETFASTMGPLGGNSEILVSRRLSSPFFAALVNASSSHVVEQDDVHNTSIFHPATVVFPAALAVAQEKGVSGKDLITASVVGYETGVRVGEFLGPSHYKVFHTTGTAGTLAAAAAVAHLLKADENTMQHTLGSAGTQAAGLWEFLRDAADSKQLHTAKAASNGILAAYLAKDGFTGAARILEGSQGMGAGMSSETHPEKLIQNMGTKWAVCETSLKYHASCRHTHPSADALLRLMQEYNLHYKEIEKVTTNVYQAAEDVLGPVIDPETVHQSKFCMGFVLALIARNGSAGISDFNEEALKDKEIRNLCQRVEMKVDPEIEEKYPQYWSARVEVETIEGKRFTMRTEIPKGDPGNRLTKTELEEKVLRLAEYQNGATQEEMARIIERVWTLDEVPRITRLLGN